ncbi:MAG: hypothetical protein R3F14_19580 [Polyangiaceae bacterium]
MDQCKPNICVTGQCKAVALPDGTVIDPGDTNIAANDNTKDCRDLVCQGGSFVAVTFWHTIRTRPTAPSPPATATASCKTGAGAMQAPVGYDCGGGRSGAGGPVPVTSATKPLASPMPLRRPLLLALAALASLLSGCFLDSGAFRVRGRRRSLSRIGRRGHDRHLPTTGGLGGAGGTRGAGGTPYEQPHHHRARRVCRRRGLPSRPAVVSSNARRAGCVIKNANEGKSCDYP